MTRVKSLCSIWVSLGRSYSIKFFCFFCFFHVTFVWANPLCQRDFFIVSDYEGIVTPSSRESTINNYIDLLNPSKFNKSFAYLFKTLSGESLTGRKEKCDRLFGALVNLPSLASTFVHKKLKNFSTGRADVFLNEFFADRTNQVQHALETMQHDHVSPFIFVSNGNVDSKKSFFKYKEKKPRKVLAFYTLNSTQEDITKGLLSYHLAFDIALQEFSAKRLQYKSAMQVGQIELEQLKRMKKSTLTYQICDRPKKFLFETDNAKLKDLSVKINQLIERKCNHI